MKIVSFNLRCAWDKDGINSFLHRAGSILYKIDTEKPDVIAFQEGTEKNIAFLQSYLIEYAFIFQQREADLTGEGLCVAFRKAEYTATDARIFWLSETPEVPGSRFAEQSRFPRICQCVTLKRPKDNCQFSVYNIHLDHVSDSARILGIRIALEQIAGMNAANPKPFFILGDFNARPESETIAYCNAYEPLPIVDITSSIPFTFHKYGQAEALRKIDYIYTDPKTAKKEWQVCLWDDTADGIYLSDHYPICLDITL